MLSKLAAIATIVTRIPIKLALLIKILGFPDLGQLVLQLQLVSLLRPLNLMDSFQNRVRRVLRTHRLY